MNVDYGAVIIGGAFSEATAALMLKCKKSDARVLIIKKTAELDRKVGADLRLIFMPPPPEAAACSSAAEPAPRDGLETAAPWHPRHPRDPRVFRNFFEDLCELRAAISGEGQ